MIFGHVLKKHISMNPVISGLLLLGVVICVYCISIMLGLAVGQYQLATCSNTEASLTIDIDEKNGINMDEMSAYLNSISKKGMISCCLALLIFMSWFSFPVSLVKQDGG